MGHIIFCILHLAAVLFGFVGLFITIPLHLIYTAVSKGKTPKKQKTNPFSPY